MRRYEPRIALNAGVEWPRASSPDHHRRVARTLRRRRVDGGNGDGAGERGRETHRGAGLRVVAVINDFAGHPRVVRASGVARVGQNGKNDNSRRRSAARHRHAQRQQERRAADHDGVAADRPSRSDLSNVPRLRDVKTAMELLRQLGVRRAGSTIIASSLHAAKRYFARGVLRSGQDDARVVRRARAAAGADRTRAGVDSGWMRDRRASGESAHRGNSRARQQDSVSSRLRRGARRQADRRPHLARFAIGRRD